MTTLANLTTVNISTCRITIQNPHYLLFFYFFFPFLLQIFSKSSFFTNQVFPLPKYFPRFPSSPNIFALFYLVFSSFTDQMILLQKNVLLLLTLHTATSGSPHMMDKSIESLDKCPNHCHSILTSNYERSQWTNFHSMLRE